MSKVIIAGGRDFNNRDLLFSKCDNILQNIEVEEIVSGGARGADTLAERYAFGCGLNFRRFPADWDKNGRAAGIIRNSEMAEYATHLIAFWDGKSRGTKHMIDTAETKGLKVRVVRYD